MRLKIGVIATAAMVFIAAGCGGSAGGHKAGAMGAAAVAPGSAAAYVAVDSNLDSAAWTKAKALLDRFPGKDKFIAHLRSSLQQEGLDWETDVKPALGSEIDLVWLDFQHNGNDVVGVTKPKDAAKFDALLAKGSNPLVQEQVDGWTVFAESQAILDAFDKARNDSGSLEDDSAFSDHFSALPAESIATAWARGDPVQAAFDKRLQAAGLPAGTTKSQFGTLEALTAAVTPASDGIQVNSTFSGNLDLGVSNYTAELPASVPGGAIAYVSFNKIGERINKLIDKLGGSIPNFDQQRAAIELVLGYTLKDVFGLLNGEGGLAIYANEGGQPAVLFVANVDDESKARNILDRLATIGAATGGLHIQSVQVGSVQAKEIKLGNGTSVYVTVFDGKLVATNSRAMLEKLQGSGPKLADDSAYKSALASAAVPDQTSGFLYADAKETIEYGLDYEKAHGATIPQVDEDNIAPLRGLVVYGSENGDDFTLTGFLGIQ